MMRTALRAALVVMVAATPSGAMAQQAETAEQYQARAARSYESKYIPEALAQIAKKVDLTAEDRDAIAAAMREHIRRFLELSTEKSCLSRSDWEILLGQFDRSVAKRVSAPIAEAITRWRAQPSPEGGPPRFLFAPPSTAFATFERIVVERSTTGAVDCGFQHDLCGMLEVEQCVIASVKARTAFRALYEDHGIDSQIAHALVGRADGTGAVLYWDSMGSSVTERPCHFRVGQSLLGGEHLDCE